MTPREQAELMLTGLAEAVNRATLLFDGNGTASMELEGVSFLLSYVATRNLFFVLAAAGPLARAEDESPHGRVWREAVLEKLLLENHPGQGSADGTVASLIPGSRQVALHRVIPLPLPPEAEAHLPHLLMPIVGALLSHALTLRELFAGYEPGMTSDTSNPAPEVSGALRV